MSKAILMIDMPENCGDCWLSTYNKERGYMVCTKEQMSVNMFDKPDWCPLIPEPEKHATYDNKHEHSADYYLGWNACIDTLEGKSNE